MHLTFDVGIERNVYLGSIIHLKANTYKKNSGFTAPDAFRAQDSCPDTFADSK